MCWCNLDTLWKNAGDALKTSTTYLSTSGFVPNAAEWTTVPVKISLQNYKNAPLYLAFKSRNGNGQNIYIDNINIYSVAPLPLKLTSFTVQQNAKNVLCKWETNQEENVNNFNIERSINGKTFESIGTTKASGKTTAAAFYQYTDENAYKLNATTLYYRLKMIDNDGKFSYSNIVYIKLGEKQSVLLYPNPAKDLINLQINNTAAATINNTIQIVDELGRVLLEKKVIVTTGTQSFELNTTSLSKGNYVIVIKGEGEVKTMKFIKD